MALKKNPEIVPVREEGLMAISGASLEYVAVDNFTTDRSYQRPPDESRINKLAKKWKDEGMGVVIASRREGETRDYLLDGQHRIGALRRLGRKTDLAPTLILQGLTVAQEAEFFELMNKDRRALLPSELFRASLAKGDEAAHEIKGVLDKYDLTLNSYGAEPNNVRAVSALWGIYNSMGVAGVDATISMCIQAWGVEADNSFNQAILKSVARILHYNEGSIKIDRLRSTLAQNTPDAWLARAGQLRAINGSDKIRTLAQAMADAYNKGLRSSSEHLDVNKMNQKKDSFKAGQKFERNKKAS